VPHPHPFKIVILSAAKDLLFVFAFAVASEIGRGFSLGNCDSFSRSGL
jgi:hypothetical protein